ncbi:transglycosylase family protein [Streptomyces sp. NPDC004126]|uniref:transglycosylase family protein n=1 Tax=Streptomyces sp. NPDC004126 TaxID=3390695 RepID=UPI003CFCB453
MRSAARKKSVLLTTATALLAIAAPLATSTSASAASVATWDKVAHCESTDNWSINTGNGYYGGLQILKSTWDAFGGRTYAAYPHQATKQQQILIAEKILAGQGAGAWGSCGSAAGLAYDHADPYPSGPTYPSPSSLADGTLVKSPNGPAVKVMIKGAGVPVAGSDVTPDHYDLSKIVLIEDSAFNALPASPPAGTVVHDQAGGASRYVIIAGAALHIGAGDWTANGYNALPDMGVPTAWLQAAAAKAPANGTVVMDQSGGPARYVMVNGTAVPISAAEWTANGYNQRPEMGVPTSWLAAAAAKQLANGTVVKKADDPTIYVMAGGKAVSLTWADFTGLGYDKRPLETIPGTWLGTAVAKTAPADGTMLLAQGDATVWQVTGGKKRAMTADEFGPGKLSFNDVVSVPAALITGLPTA